MNTAIDATIVLQGRLRSTRLPGKGFFTFFGQTLWERMCDIALAVVPPEQVVFATGDLPENHLIRPSVERKGVRFYAGSEDDVLERYCCAIEGMPQKYAIRMTCDNYLIQPDVIEGIYRAVQETDADYGAIRNLSHYAGEIIRSDVLREQRSSPYDAMAKEHVTWGIRHSDRYRQATLPEDYLGLNHRNSATLDTIEDLIQMKVWERDIPGMADVRCLSSLAAAQR